MNQRVLRLSIHRSAQICPHCEDQNFEYLLDYIKCMECGWIKTNAEFEEELPHLRRIV